MRFHHSKPAISRAAVYRRRTRTSDIKRFGHGALFLLLVFMLLRVAISGVTVFKFSGGALAILVLFTLRCRERKGPIVDSYVIALTVVLIAGIVGSFSFGAINSQSIQKMVMNIVLMVVVAELITENSGFRLILAALATGGLVVLVSGFLDISGSGPTVRIGGLVSNPNGFGQLCAMTSVCLTGLAVLARHRSVKVILLSLIAASFIGLMYSASRGAFVGLGAGLLALALFRRMRKFGVVLLLLCVVSVTWFAPQVFFDRWQTGFQSTKAGRQSGIERRLELSKKGLEIFSGNPTFGVGLGNTTWAMRDRGDRVQVTHNAFVQCLTETGLVGFLAFLFVAMSSARGFYRVAQSRAADSQLSVTSSAFFVLFVVTVVSQASSGNFVHPIWYVLFGVVSNLVRLNRAWRTDVTPVFDQSTSRGGSTVIPHVPT